MQESCFHVHVQKQAAPWGPQKPPAPTAPYTYGHSNNPYIHKD